MAELHWLVWLAGAIVVVGGAEEVLRRLIFKPLRRLFRKAEAIADTWNGEPARDGLPARPGVIDRIVGIEAAIRVNGTGLAIGDAVASLMVRGQTNSILLGGLEVGQVEAKAAAERAAELAREAALRAAEIDERVKPWIDHREQQLETFRSALVEIGIDEDLPKRSPDRRDREGD